MRTAAASLIVLSVLGLTACGGGGSEEPATGEETSGGEEGGAGYDGPIASTDTAKGKETFDTFCEDCHPGGEEDVGPSLIADPHSPAQLRKQVREGSGKMRPFSAQRLPDEDLEHLLAYLQSINAVK